MKVAHPVRVLIVEDLTIVREGLRALLQGYPNIEVVGEASDGEDACCKAAKLNPTIVLMDVSMPKMDGITATRMIKQQFPEIAVVGLTANPPETIHYAMSKAGASEVVSKEQAVTELYSAIQRAVASVQPILIFEDEQVEAKGGTLVEDSNTSAVGDAMPLQNPPDSKAES